VTCIAVLAQDGVVHAAYDSEVSDANNGETLTMKTPKVAVNGGYLIGVSQSLRVANLLHHMELPQVPKSKGALSRHMAIDFARAIAEILSESPGISTDEKIEEDTDIIVGVGGRVFVYGDDYSVHEPSHPFTAIGSGYGPAMGSLITSQRFDITPKERVVSAVEAAAYASIGVREPVRYVSL
jgi:hypothetical protein